MMIACIVVKRGWLLYRIRDDEQLFTLMQSVFVHLGLDRSTVDLS
jgi:hypothetical protein